MKLNKKEISELNKKAVEYYINNDIENGYCLFSFNKNVLTVSFHFYSYEDAGYIGKEDMPMTGKHEVTLQGYRIEEMINNFDAEMKDIIDWGFFYRTMKELWSA